MKRAIYARYCSDWAASSPTNPVANVFLYTKCILCWRCVQVCANDAQYVFALNFSGRVFGTHIATFYDRPMPATTCVFCGQCVGVCPTGALKTKREWLLEKGLIPEASPADE